MIGRTEDCPSFAVRLGKRIVDPVLKFEFAQLLWVWLTPVLALVLLLFPRPRRFWVRCLIATLLGWLCTILFTTLVYNPSGIAAGHALGQNFPEGRYDNNTSSIAIFFGWICPAILVAVFAGVRFAWLRFRRRGA